MILKRTKEPILQGANSGGQKINYLQLVIFFLLGILIASNVFLLWTGLSQKQEIEKLKTDDVMIAQAINKILNQIQPAATSSTPQK